MRKALANVMRLYEPAQATWIQALLERVERMPRATRLFARMASAPDKEQLDDYLAEAVYALVFAGLGFTVTVEPFGDEGPDLEVSRGGHHAVVEITRFRKIYPGDGAFLDVHDVTTVGSAGRDFLIDCPECGLSDGLESGQRVV